MSHPGVQHGGHRSCVAEWKSAHHSTGGNKRLHAHGDNILFFLNIKRLVMGYMVCLVFCLVYCIRCRLSNCPLDCFRVITRQSLMRKRLITVAELYTWFMSMNRAKSMIQSSHKSDSFAFLNEKQHRSKFKPQKQ